MLIRRAISLTGLHCHDAVLPHDICTGHSSKAARILHALLVYISVVLYTFCEKIQLDVNSSDNKSSIWSGSQREQVSPVALNYWGLMTLGSFQTNNGSLGSYIAASETFWLHFESPQMRILVCYITKEREDAACNFWKRIHELGIERHSEEHAKCLVSGLLERGNGINTMHNGIAGFYTRKLSRP